MERLFFQPCWWGCIKDRFVTDSRLDYPHPHSTPHRMIILHRHSLLLHHFSSRSRVFSLLYFFPGRLGVIDSLPVLRALPEPMVPESSHLELPGDTKHVAEVLRWAKIWFFWCCPIWNIGVFSEATALEHLPDSMRGHPFFFFFTCM